MRRQHEARASSSPPALPSPSAIGVTAGGRYARGNDGTIPPFDAELGRRRRCIFLVAVIGFDRADRSAPSSGAAGRFPCRRGVSGGQQGRFAAVLAVAAAAGGARVSAVASAARLAAGRDLRGGDALPLVRLRRAPRSARPACSEGWFVSAVVLRQAGGHGAGRRSSSATSTGRRMTSCATPRGRTIRRAACSTGCPTVGSSHDRRSPTLAPTSAPPPAAALRRAERELPASLPAFGPLAALARQPARRRVAVARRRPRSAPRRQDQSRASSGDLGPLGRRPVHQGGRVRLPLAASTPTAPRWTFPGCR